MPSSRPARWRWLDCFCGVRDEAIKQALAQGFSAGVDWCCSEKFDADVAKAALAIGMGARRSDHRRASENGLMEIHENGKHHDRTQRKSKLHDLALSVVRSKGVTAKLEGSTTVLEYRYGRLLIQYRSGRRRARRLV